MSLSEEATKVVDELKAEYDMIRSIGSLFLYTELDIDELSDTLEKMEDLPENCLFSDDLLDQMRSSRLYWIRRLCAMNGRDKDLDILVTDPNDLVRFEVLFHKRPQDLKILKEDRNPDIRQAAVGWYNSNCGQNGILGRY